EPLSPVPVQTRGTGPHCDGHTAAGCSESHSAVPLPGRPFALTIDEVYGSFTTPSFGWPWGWARLWNIAQPRRPHIIGQYKLLQNTSAYTPAPGENGFNSYSSHNPTVLRDLIFDSWHSGGEQAIDVSDPGSPGSETSIACSPPECRSEEHTSELQSRGHLVCRLLLEKKKKKHNTHGQHKINQ